MCIRDSQVQDPVPVPLSAQQHTEPIRSLFPRDEVADQRREMPNIARAERGAQFEQSPLPSHTETASIQRMVLSRTIVSRQIQVSRHRMAHRRDGRADGAMFTLAVHPRTLR
eukprot:TRINITY_DN65723_c0_g1_i1.p2 TRINITY_DN65723_c0_g1~~TRINITY_DN65723_c0_g1_i1.p2  ORF type:complete len:112 (+),score=17.93 TRINITY_DN65723_c0_g1_i1:89-424(+)